MKEVSGNLWFTTEKETTNIGFTKTFLEQRMIECFHVVLADTKNVKEKGPLLVLETNDGLEPVCSPVSGRIIYFNDKARNFPDRLREDEIIVTLTTAKEGEAAKKTPEYIAYGDVMVAAQQNRGVINNWGQAQFQAAVAPPGFNVPVLEGLLQEPIPPIRGPGEAAAEWNQRVIAWSEERRRIRRHNEQIRMNNAVRNLEAGAAVRRDR